MMNLLLSMQDNSFLIWSCIYPIIGVLLWIAMIIAYVKAKSRKLVIVFVSIPSFSLLYAIVYISIYCAATIKDGTFNSIFVIRSFEGFVTDFIVWIVLFIHSTMRFKPLNSNDNQRRNNSEISEEEKIKITNF